MNSLIKDLRFAFRIFLRKPGFTLIAVLSLALGIGANTAIFSLLDAVMLKSLPVQQPDQLVLFGNGKSGGRTDNFPDSSTDLFSYQFYRTAQKRGDVFSDVAAQVSLLWTVHGRVNANGQSSEIEKINAQMVSGTYFTTLGVNPALGRLFTDADDQNVGGHPVVVVSNAWWQKNLGGDASALSKTITIDQVTYSVIGVAPNEFFGTKVGEAPDIWVPLAMEKDMPPAYWDGRNENDFQTLYLIGRLQKGVSATQANAVVNLIFKQSLQDRAGAQPTAELQQKIQTANVELTPVGRGLSDLRTEFSLSLKVLMAVVGLVLLIACANVANLLLAHGASRRREFAVRLAVGARRSRLIRQLLTESLLLGIIGGAAGVGVAWWGSRMLVVMASSGPEALPVNVSPNLRVLGFTLVASLLSALVFGIAPALRGSKLDPGSSLKGKNITRQVFQGPLGKALVVGQVALSLLLLVGAGLFVRTLINLQKVPTGYNEENVTLFDVDASAPGIKSEDPRYLKMLSDVETQVKAVPGVTAASFTFFVFHQGAWTSPAFTAGSDLPMNQRVIRNNCVSGDFFTTMGIPLVAGRNFNSFDTDKSQKVAVITESLAKRFFPNDAVPIGKRFGIGGPGSLNDIEIIGVVKDAKYGSVTEQIRPMAYYALVQEPQPVNNLVVRFNGSAGSIIPQIRAAIKQVNNNLPIDDVVPLSDFIDRSLTQQRLIARVASFFGLLALLLASVGLYGVMSYAVARRTNEIGIRMALGAPRTNVLWLILREVFLLVGIGLVLGIGVALATTRAAETLLFGLKPNDPLTIAGAATLLLVVAALSGYLPARRASRVNPMVALREE
ncbi:MAG TPA: ABC transporter permease [Pyrinomonadaceae bacterium]